MRPRALDLFCRAGGVSEGLLRAGFDVVGVDILDCAKAYNRGPGNPDRHERPAQFVQSDALEVLDHLAKAQRGALAPLFEEPPFRGGFDFIWASPPCQAHSILRKLTPGKEYPDLIPATRARLIASGIPYAIENVPGAPLGGFLVQLCGTMFGLQTPDGRAELRRHRLFETSWPIALRPACQHGHEGIRESLTGKETEQARRRAVIPVHGTGSPIDNRRRWERRRCTCPTECDCQDFENGLVSNECPEHNLTPRPAPGSPEHDPAPRKVRVLCVAGGKAMSGGMMTPQGEMRRRALSVTGHSAEAKRPGWKGDGSRADRESGRETFSTADARHAMGIDWMAMKDLSQAIPPAYAEWLGRQALDMLAAEAPRLRATP